MDVAAFAGAPGGGGSRRRIAPFGAAAFLPPTAEEISVAVDIAVVSVRCWEKKKSPMWDSDCERRGIGMCGKTRRSLATTSARSTSRFRRDFSAENPTSCSPYSRL